MRSEVQHGVSIETCAQVAIESAEGVRGCKPCFEQQAHRVTFVAKPGLDANQGLPELHTLHKHTCSVGQLFAGCRAPLRFNLFEPRLMLNML